MGAGSAPEQLRSYGARRQEKPLGHLWHLTGKRIFRMTPLQHHFELLGWEQVWVVIRFWIIAGSCVAAGLGIFYSDWVGSLS